MKRVKPEVAIGDAIRTERKKLGMSQEELAHECELHRTYVGSVERGERNISLKNLLVISKVLHLTGAELLRRAGL